MSTKAYREANREKIIEYSRAYNKANREERAEYSRAYYKANREKCLAYHRAYNEANKEKLAEYRRAYDETNQANCFIKQRWIYDARKERGYSQKVLAELVGVSTSAIEQLELGKRKLDSFRAKDKLLAVLGREA